MLVRFGRRTSGPAGTAPPRAKLVGPLVRKTPHSSKNRSHLNPIVRMPIFSIGSRDSGAAVPHKHRTVHFQKASYPIGAGSYMALIKLFPVKMVLGAQVPCKKHRLFLCCACTLRPSYLLACRVPLRQGLNWLGLWHGKPLIVARTGVI